MNEAERAAFLAAISADRYDEVARKIFADQLDDHGLYDEAAAQRSWTPRKQKAEDDIREFANQINQSYDDLMGAADRWLESEDYTYDNSESYKDVDYAEWSIFWDNYEAVTEKQIKSQDKGSFFTCSC